MDSILPGYIDFPRQHQYEIGIHRDLDNNTVISGNGGHLITGGAGDRHHIRRLCITLTSDGDRCSEIPGEILDLKNLEYLAVVGNRHTTFNDIKNIVDLDSVTELVFVNMETIIFGRGIRKMGNVRTLSLYNIHAQAAFDNIFKMTNVENLILNNCTSTYPGLDECDMSRMLSLSFLRYENMNLDKLPESLVLLHNLKVICLVGISHLNKPLNQHVRIKDGNNEIVIDILQADYVDGVPTYNMGIPSRYTNGNRVPTDRRTEFQKMWIEHLTDCGEGFKIPQINSLESIYIDKCNSITKLHGDFQKMYNLAKIHVSRCLLLNRVCDIPPIYLKELIVIDCANMYYPFRKIVARPYMAYIEGCINLRSVALEVDDGCLLDTLIIKNYAHLILRRQLDLRPMPSVRNLALVGTMYNVDLAVFAAAFNSITKLDLIRISPIGMDPRTRTVRSLYINLDGNFDAVQTLEKITIDCHPIFNRGLNGQLEDLHTLSEQFYNKPNLKELYLINVGVGSLPDTVAETLPCLERLVIIGCSRAFNLGSYIYRFRNLTHLEFAQNTNSQNEFPEHNNEHENNLSNTLETLVLHNLTSIPAGMMRMLKLRIIELIRCRLLVHRPYYANLYMPSLIDITITNRNAFDWTPMSGDMIHLLIDRASALESFNIHGISISISNNIRDIGDIVMAIRNRGDRHLVRLMIQNCRCIPNQFDDVRRL